MIYLLYGEDGLSLEEALASLKANAGPEELQDINISTLDGAAVGFDEFAATCSTVPFLADKRVVIVRGLLSRFETRGFGATRSQARTKQSESVLGAWDGMKEYLPTVPDTTDLIFVDGRVSARNPLMGHIKPHATVQTFPMPSVRDLPGWIRGLAEKLGVSIEPRAIATLAETIGADTRVLDSELRKLALYSSGETITQGHVNELVSYAREASIFAAVDAVLEGRAGAALRMIQQITSAGHPATYVITMIARQSRLLLLAKDLRAQRVPHQEMGSRLSLSGYPLTKTLEQEGRFTTERLKLIHRKLLEADIAIKTGAADEQMALDMLIVELSASYVAGTQSLS
ncbi:MAG: DNA polymerase III subunit delta [Chloroflexi bacterium]|nr:DNA polymerase III subunit delta [Chloroflexota bacterium]